MAPASSQARVSDPQLDDERTTSARAQAEAGEEEADGTEEKEGEESVEGSVGFGSMRFF